MSIILSCNEVVFIVFSVLIVVLRFDKVVTWFYCEYFYSVSCLGNPDKSNQNKQTNNK